MARVTSKLQVTIPKAIAEQYGIEPGSEIDWLPAGDAIRVVAASHEAKRLDPARRLALFDQASERQREREARRKRSVRTGDRGWTREELYDRAGSR